MRSFFTVVLGVLLLLVAWSCLYTVDRTEFVYLTQFGKHLATFDGSQEDQAGLHVKWPWPVQSVLRFDRRLQAFDLPPAEMLTHDPKGGTIDKTLTLDAYVCWRIPGADAVERFVRTVGTLDLARSLLTQRIGSDLGAIVGQMELSDLINDQPGLVDRKREELRRRLLSSPAVDGVETKGLQQRALEEYGIEIVDIRVRRLNHPPQVRQAIFDRIISERNKKVAYYRSEGQKQAENIKSDSDRKIAELQAITAANTQRIRGEADAEATRILNEAQALDPQFYAFLKKLEEYQRILGDNKTMLLLSSHRELFDLLFSPPKPGMPAKPPK
jgi:membrane protease subunit HflC